MQQGVGLASRLGLKIPVGLLVLGLVAPLTTPAKAGGGCSCYAGGSQSGELMSIVPNLALSTQFPYGTIVWRWEQWTTHKIPTTATSRTPRKSRKIHSSGDGLENRPRVVCLNRGLPPPVAHNIAGEPLDPLTPWIPSNQLGRGDPFERDRPPLEMHVLPGTSGTNYDATGGGAVGDAGGAFGDIAGGTHKGYDFTDTAGTAGQTPGFRDFGGGGGVAATFDARKWLGLGGNQSLLFGASVDGQSYSRTFDADVGKISGASVGGSVSALYASRAFYATGGVQFDWGRADITDNTTTGQGTYNSNDVSTDVRIGKVFPLWGSGGNRGSLKDSNGYAPLFLDVSGHIGYARSVDGGYTDTTGAVFGDETEQYWTGGGRVRLMSFMRSNGILWTPFVGATIDQQFDYNHTFDIPAQGARQPTNYCSRRRARLSVPREALCAYEEWSELRRHRLLFAQCRPEWRGRQSQRAGPVLAWSH